ncbi:MAG: cytochrome P460 family protein, partial [Acidiferrobacterales bacterium]
MRYTRLVTATTATLCIAAALGFLFTTEAASQSVERADIEMSDISGEIDKPRRHFRLRNPADLMPKEAVEFYSIIADALKAGYQRSGHAVAEAYQGWKRYNTAPYLSLSHGNHYLNNYANPTAKAYGAFEDAGTMPVGSIIAKDSFSVTVSRGIVLGPLFIAEKMPPGFNHVTGDWKYTEILPDGTLLGETNGEGSERVKYCIACHLAVEKQDHLYFVPREYR